jgi:hypothetical protein
MSIISCTSPSASLVILPVSADTMSASWLLAARSSSPIWRTSKPRRGAGTARHLTNAAAAAAIARSISSGVVSSTCAIVSPVMGERTMREPGRAPDGRGISK